MLPQLSAIVIQAGLERVAKHRIVLVNQTATTAELATKMLLNPCAKIAMPVGWAKLAKNHVSTVNKNQWILASVFAKLVGLVMVATQSARSMVRLTLLAIQLAFAHTPRVSGARFVKNLGVQVMVPASLGSPMALEKLQLQTFAVFRILSVWKMENLALETANAMRPMLPATAKPDGKVLAARHLTVPAALTATIEVSATISL
jgi:hypothetical protein